MIGEPIFVLDSVDSTNSHMQHLLDKEPLMEGTIVLAHKQNRGRGMQNNVWESEAGLNLTFSVVLYPYFLDVNHLFALNQIVALALREVLENATGYHFKVKWPNDVMFENQKVAGILIENSFRGNHIKYSVIGIGLNVNQEQFQNYKPSAVSIKTIAKKQFDLEILLKRFCNKLQDYYNILNAGDFIFLHREYLQHLYRYNEEHLYKRNGIYFKAVIKGVQADGKLLLASDSDIEQIIDIKEIQFVY